MLKVLIGVIAASSLAACATVNSADDVSSGSKLSDTYFSGFTPKSDGSYVHGGTGLVCPSSLLKMPYDDQHEYGNQHKDASCTYRQGGNLATIYLSELNYSFEEIFQSSVASIYQGSFGKALEVDETVSQTCALGGLLVAASAESRDQGVYKFQPAVLRSSDVLTMVQLSELDGKFLKLRYTLTDETQVEGLSRCLEASKALRDVYDLSRETSRRAVQN